jgi:hypothetical protein
MGQFIPLAIDDNFEASIIAKVRELLENDPENTLRMCDLGITLAKVGKKPIGTKLKQLLHKDPNVAKDFDITGDFGSEKIRLTYKVGPSLSCPLRPGMYDRINQREATCSDPSNPMRSRDSSDGGTDMYVHMEGV